MRTGPGLPHLHRLVGSVSPALDELERDHLAKDRRGPPGSGCLGDPELRLQPVAAGEQPPAGVVQRDPHGLRLAGVRARRWPSRPRPPCGPARRSSACRHRDELVALERLRHRQLERERGMSPRPAPCTTRARSRSSRTPSRRTPSPGRPASYRAAAAAAVVRRSSASGRRRRTSRSRSPRRPGSGSWFRRAAR